MRKTYQQNQSTSRSANERFKNKRSHADVPQGKPDKFKPVQTDPNDPKSTDASKPNQASQAKPNKLSENKRHSMHITPTQWQSDINQQTTTKPTIGLTRAEDAPQYLRLASVQ